MAGLARALFRCVSNVFFQEARAGLDVPELEEFCFKFEEKDWIGFYIVLYLQVIFLLAGSFLSLRFLGEFGIALVAGAVLASIFLDLAMLRFLRAGRKMYLGKHSEKEAVKKIIRTPPGHVNGFSSGTVSSLADSLSAGLSYPISSYRRVLSSLRRSSQVCSSC